MHTGWTLTVSTEIPEIYRAPNPRKFSGPERRMSCLYLHCARAEAGFPSFQLWPLQDLSAGKGRNEEEGGEEKKNQAAVERRDEKQKRYSQGKQEGKERQYSKQKEGDPRASQVDRPSGRPVSSCSSFFHVRSVHGSCLLVGCGMRRSLGTVQPFNVP
jgi:hypothetical protein